MESAEAGHANEERPDLPVSLLVVLYAWRLQCEKSVELTSPPIAPASVLAEIVGTNRLYESQSPLEL